MVQESRKMEQDFAGRVVLITGGNHGLGRATAGRFLNREHPGRG